MRQLAKTVDPVGSARARMLPARFAWTDHRLRDRLRGRFQGLSLEEIALLFFLPLAADKTGCSFWAGSTIAKKLGLREGEVIEARYRLVARA